jgi:hypothetical protein
MYPRWGCCIFVVWNWIALLLDTNSLKIKIYLETENAYRSPILHFLTSGTPQTCPKYVPKASCCDVRGLLCRIDLPRRKDLLHDFPRLETPRVCLSAFIVPSTSKNVVAFDISKGLALLRSKQRTPPPLPSTPFPGRQSHSQTSMGLSQL